MCSVAGQTANLTEIKSSPCEAGFTVTLSCSITNGYQNTTAVLFYDNNNRQVSTDCTIIPPGARYNFTKCDRVNGVFNLQITSTTPSDTGNWKCDYSFDDDPHFIFTGN